MLPEYINVTKSCRKTKNQRKIEFLAGQTPSESHFSRECLEYPIPVFELEYPEYESEILLSLGAFCGGTRNCAMGAKSPAG